MGNKDSFKVVINPDKTVDGVKKGSLRYDKALGEVCKNCSGEGYTTMIAKIEPTLCPKCDGQWIKKVGHADCPMCKGSGFVKEGVKCIKCSGKGTVLKRFRMPLICQECNPKNPQSLFNKAINSLPLSRRSKAVEITRRAHIPVMVLKHANCTSCHGKGVIIPFNPVLSLTKLKSLKIGE